MIPSPGKGQNELQPGNNKELTGSEGQGADGGENLGATSGSSTSSDFPSSLDVAHQTRTQPLALECPCTNSCPFPDCSQHSKPSRAPRIPVNPGKQGSGDP